MNRLLMLLAILVLIAIPAHGQDGEFMVGGVTQSTWRSMRTVSEGGGTQFNRVQSSLRGGEVMLRGGGAGIYLRYLSGDFGGQGSGNAGGELSLGDARLLLGPRVFSLEFGYQRREYGEASGLTPLNLWRGGARFHLDLGPSGLGVFMAGSAVFRIEDDQEPSGSSFLGEVSLAGSEAETGLIYQAPRGLPFFARLGYRYARLDEPGPDGTGLREESLSGVVLSAGFRLIAAALR